MNQPSIQQWPVVGHDWAIMQIQRAFDNQRIRHAYLMQGPASIGKTTFANAIAMTLNCTGAVRPCGECRACRLIAQNNHPDVQIIEAERIGGTLKIAQVRELQHTLAMRPYEGRYRVAILRRFQEAQAAAQNAILKTLEEPAGNVVIILTAEEPSAILPTIHSRCQIFNLRPLSVERVRTVLQDHYSISPEKAMVLAHLSGGRIGWAVKSIEDEDAFEFRNSAIGALEQAIKTSKVERFKLAEALSGDKSNLVMMLDFWQAYWRDIMLLASGSQALLVNVDREPVMLTIAQTIGKDKAHASVEATRKAITQLNANANARLCLEVLLLNYPRV